MFCGGGIYFFLSTELDFFHLFSITVIAEKFFLQFHATYILQNMYGLE
jgi:hypothetical protein